MQYVVCAVRDIKSEAFGRPFFTNTAGVAVRSFHDEVNREAADNEMYRHASDFALFQLGHFNDQDGGFVNLPVPKLLIEGSQCRNQRELDALVKEVQHASE